MAIGDMWDGDVGRVATSPTPVSILREQARYLADHTDNALFAKISTSQFGETFIHYFTIVAPALDGYSYTLFTLSHDLDLYPATFRFGDEERVAHDEAEFSGILRDVLRDKRTKEVTSTLRSMSER
jgi:hypothetical protein